MDPLTLGIMGGLNIFKGLLGASQKKKQMLAAAEQTRYSPWTGETGNAAFNAAAAQNPYGEMMGGLASSFATSMAQGAAADKAKLEKEAVAASNPVNSALSNFKMANQQPESDNIYKYLAKA